MLEKYLPRRGRRLQMTTEWRTTPTRSSRTTADRTLIGKSPPSKKRKRPHQSWRKTPRHNFCIDYFPSLAHTCPSSSSSTRTIQLCREMFPPRNSSTSLRLRRSTSLVRTRCRGPRQRLTSSPRGTASALGKTARTDLGAIIQRTMPPSEKPEQDYNVSVPVEGFGHIPNSPYHNTPHFTISCTVQFVSVIY